MVVISYLLVDGETHQRAFSQRLDTLVRNPFVGCFLFKNVCVDVVPQHVGRRRQQEIHMNYILGGKAPDMYCQIGCIVKLEGGL